MDDNEQHLTELLTNALNAAREAEKQLRLDPPPLSSTPLRVIVEPHGEVPVPTFGIGEPSTRQFSYWTAVICVLILLLLVFLVVRACRSEKTAMPSQPGDLHHGPAPPPMPPMTTDLSVEAPTEMVSDPPSVEVPAVEVPPVGVPTESHDDDERLKPAPSPPMKDPAPGIQVRPPENPKPTPPLPQLRKVEPAPSGSWWTPRRKQENDRPEVIVGDQIEVRTPAYREPQPPKLLSKLRFPSIPSDALRSRVSDQGIVCKVFVTVNGQPAAACGPSDLSPFILQRAKELLEKAQWQPATNIIGEPCPGEVTVRFGGKEVAGGW